MRESCSTGDVAAGDVDTLLVGRIGWKLAASGAGGDSNRLGTGAGGGFSTRFGTERGGLGLFVVVTVEDDGPAKLSKALILAWREDISRCAMPMNTNWWYETGIQAREHLCLSTSATTMSSTNDSFQLYAVAGRLTFQILHCVILSCLWLPVDFCLIPIGTGEPSVCYGLRSDRVSMSGLTLSLHLKGG